MDKLMRSLCGRLAGAFALSVALLAGGQARAALQTLAPGQDVSLVGQGTDYTGTLVASTTVQANLNPAAPDLTATIREAVFRNANGTLDFLFQVTNTSDGSLGLIANLADVTFGNFGGGSDRYGPIQVDYLTNLNLDSFIAPTATSGTNQSTPLNASRGTTGSAINFGFDTPNTGTTPGLAAGATSNILIISTSATNFNDRGSSQINGETDANGNSLGSNIAGGIYEPAPAATVPEPSTLAGAGIAGLFGLVLAFRRKRAA